MAVALRNVEMPARVERDFVRHVQRGRRRGSTIAAVPASAVPGDVNGPLRAQIDPPNPLIVEIAEVQRSIGSDEDAIRIIDLSVGMAGPAVTDDG
jgi:hypothetical protein